MKTSEERLADLENWLLDEYNAALHIWAHTSNPAPKAIWFSKLQTLSGVARHLLFGSDDKVPLFEERLLPFVQHVDNFTPEDLDNADAR